jgi:hypothetical protein
VSALIIVSLVTVISMAVFATADEWPVLSTVLICFGLLSVLQLAYILGVGLAVHGERLASAALRRVRSGGGLLRNWRQLGLPAEAGSSSKREKRPEN